MATSKLKAVRKAASAAGLRTVGVFHSHPVGYAKLGPRDKRSAPLNCLHLVYDVYALDPKLWRVIRRGKRRAVVEIPLRVQRSRNARAR
jgi:proteasome lid subunit RPN8/RPN11